MTISVAIITDTATSNIDGCLTTVVYSTTAHRTHSTSAIDIVNDVTTDDVDSGSTLYDTCQRVVLVFDAVAVGVVQIRTATATIDVATISISSASINAGIGNTDFTFVDIYNGILEGVTVLATTIDRAPDVRTRCSIGIANGDMRAVNPRHAVIGVNGRLAFRSGYITT